MSSREIDVAFARTAAHRVGMWNVTAVAAAPARAVDNLELYTRKPIYKQLTPEEKFLILARRWQRESQLLSSTGEMARLESYQRIIRMGQQALPFILRELEREPDYWFIALETIADENPVPVSDRGRIQLMTDAWLRWGRERGHI
jgi:hypothetical protein